MNPSVILFSVVKDSAEPADLGIAIVTVSIPLPSLSIFQFHSEEFACFGFMEKKYFVKVKLCGENVIEDTFRTEDGKEDDYTCTGFDVIFKQSHQSHIS